MKTERQRMPVVIRNHQRKVPLDLEGFRKRIEKAVCLLGLEDCEVSFLFVNDARCRQLNHQFRGIDRPTDVLSFPLFNNLREIKKARSLGEVLLGDVVINLHFCQRISQKEDIPLEDLVLEMAIHGLLHLIGYDHEKGPSQARRMKKKEKELLHAIKKVA
ncbi:MAG: rRNA maturation RNase YbeY [Nitrospirae bacterium]|nr:MAG: rRNA maturation RNase YbeY [Nitrospirota bacterium]